MSENITKKEMLVFAGIIIAMIGALIYGFLFGGVGKIGNCWDKYPTEREAILNCEGTEGTR
jgi:hypothetical protein